MDNKDRQFIIANLINNLVKDEWEAVEGYNSAIATLSDFEGLEGILSNLEDIRDEEYVHIGQLQSCLSVLNGDPVEQIEDGSDEGFEKLELPEDDALEDEEDSKIMEPVNEPDIVDESKKTPEIDSMDVEEVKKRLKAVGFDDASFMGKSDRELRAMLKINRRARGDQALRKWKKERNGVREQLNDPPTDVTESRQESIAEGKEAEFAARLKGNTAGSSTFTFVKAEDEEQAKQKLDKKFAKLGYKITDIKRADPEATNPVDALKEGSAFEDYWNELEELED